MYSRCFLTVILGAMLGLGAGCSADAGTSGNPSSMGPDGDNGGDGGSSGGGAAGSLGNAGVGGNAGAGGIPGRGGLGGGGAGGTGVQTVDGGVSVGDIDGCVGQTATAPPTENPKVDIVWVVDASGSMLDEQQKIGANLTQFAENITTANIDVRIVMMTTAAGIPVICPPVPADPMDGTPLQGDSRYRFIQSQVDSQNALDIAMSNYGQYEDFLRPDSKVHFVVVSDDESNFNGLGSPQERAQAFQSQMSDQLGRGFTLHTISSEGPNACVDPNCMPDTSTGICAFVMLGCGAAAPGSTYYELANMTQGLTASICQSDYSKIFKPLTEAVIKSAPLPCSYDIPEPPDGQNLNPDKVNVGWTPPDGDQQIFPRAEGQQACGDELAWYYDNPETPQKVEMCPNTCERISEGGTISIAFDCDTIVIE